MADRPLRNFTRSLQTLVHPGDREWSYYVPNLPRDTLTNPLGLVKLITVVSNRTKQNITLRFDRAPANRILASDPAHRFILISFADFRLQCPGGEGQIANPSNRATEPATTRESGDYIVRLLRTGVVLNGVHYNFYGHSNSQLKSKTCFLFAGSKEEISRRIESLGDFSKIKTVAKKAKRIGLLFSSADMAMVLDPARCEDIPDIQTKDYIFTDGCGLISSHLASQLVKQRNIVFRNQRYTPSVFQIRYRGYKGVLMLEPELSGQILVKFRDSMKKFKGGEDLSFSVVAFSKPYVFGNLNDEIVLLIHSLGISAEMLLKKQKDHFDYLENASLNPQAGFRFLTYVNRMDLAEKILMEGLEAVRPEIRKLVNDEYGRMLNKRNEERCRIFVPKSRLLFGVCDSKDVLRDGECFVKVTLEGDGRAMTLANAEVIVSRNPCLHPGDVRKFKAVFKSELQHLVDCIVFPTQGKRSSADLMSGGDLDGDTFFVCWDPDLIPRFMSQPAEYPGGREPVKFDKITDDDRLQFFAKYSNASLGRVKNLFLDWARVRGPMSPECQQLNRLFSLCVDGNRVRVPTTLESPPKPDENTAPFILDVLHQAAKTFIESRQRQNQQLDGYNFDAVELLLSRENLAISQFELIQMTYRWCRRNGVSLGEFMHFFDFNVLGAAEKIWVLSQLPPSATNSALVMNSLTQSDMLKESELHQYRLHYPGMRWKCIFSSAEDRLGTFLDRVGRALSLFHRKLIIFRVDERLTVAIYVPCKVEPDEEAEVDDKVRLFAFAHTQDGSNMHRLVVRTKKNYRLYSDSTVFQLFEKDRRNTFIFIGRSQSDDSAYRGLEGKGEKRRGRQATLDTAVNYDFRASIALDKFSKNLQRHVGRVNRNGVLAAEIHVISNRDIRGQQLLDLWLEQIDTQETLPLFERKAKEYTIPHLMEVDWALEPIHLTRVVRDKDYSALKEFESAETFRFIFYWLWQRDERSLLGEIFSYLLSQMALPESSLQNISDLFATMLHFLKLAPYLAITFAKLHDWKVLPEAIQESLRNSASKLLEALIISANEVMEFILEPFETILSRVPFLSLSTFGELVETVCLAVKSPEIALDLLLQSLEAHALRVCVDRQISNPSWNGEPPSPSTAQTITESLPVIRHFVRNVIGIALDHIDEAHDSATKGKYFLELKRTDDPLVVTATLRIDAPLSDQPRLGDHIRLTSAQPPENSPIKRSYSMSALVEKSVQGHATFRCLQPPPSYVEDSSWMLLNCGSYVTTKTMSDALVQFAVEKEECCAIYGLLLDIHSGTEPLENPQDYVPSEHLNASQNEAVLASISSPLTCLWGPPGTGKTHTIVVILQELLHRYPNHRILVAAPTHNAVDNVMQKYLDKLRTQRGERVAETLALRVSTDVRKVAENLKKYTCDAMVGKDLLENPEARKKALARLKEARLVFTTCAGAGLGLLRSESFDIVIIDEASQQTEPTSLIPLVKGCSRATLVGDHVQLRATVQRHAVLEMFDISLFERLYKQHSGRGIKRVMLDTQYRMHRDICGFSSKEFYEGKLQTGVRDGERPLPLSEFEWPLNTDDVSKARTVFVQCSETEDIGQKSKSNQAQARICYEICKQLATPLNSDGGQQQPPASIAVLTPYSRQAELLKRMIPGVEVSSIDGFQGREADIIIFVTVRCNAHYELGFLKDMRRLNVTLTRAKTGLIVIGDKTTLTQCDDPESARVWKQLLESLTSIEWEATVEDGN